MSDDTGSPIIDLTSPNKDSQFQRYWVRFTDILKTRDSFNQIHLKNLEILCDLYVEYDNLADIIKEEGVSYTSAGRHGTQVKSRPEVTMRKDVLAEIRQYTKILGIVLDKGKGNEAPNNPDDEEWKDLE